VRIDVFERLPVPYGLVRFGVAPDHPDVKNVTDIFDKVAQNKNSRLFCNVHVGKDVSIGSLRSSYHALVYAYGAQSDRNLGIQREQQARNVFNARAFVEWYNGHPEHQDLDIDLSVDTAAIIGQGNVALDIARVLLSPIDHLRSTDITSRALARLAESKVRRVHVIGRRGPLEVAFTIKELREVSKINGCVSSFDPSFFTFTKV
jgi:adrenodoxin-NADP+ reductase